MTRTISRWEPLFIPAELRSQFDRMFTALAAGRRRAAVDISARTGR